MTQKSSLPSRGLQRQSPRRAGSLLQGHQTNPTLCLNNLVEQVSWQGSRILMDSLGMLSSHHMVVNHCQHSTLTTIHQQHLTLQKQSQRHRLDQDVTTRGTEATRVVPTAASTRLSNITKCLCSSSNSITTLSRCSMQECHILSITPSLTMGSHIHSRGSSLRANRNSS